MSRLSVAIEDGLDLAEQRCVVFRPAIGVDLSEFSEVQVIQGFKPAFDYFANRFDTGLQPSGDFQVALVCITRSKEETRGLIAQAAALAPLVLVDGQKTDGIESHLKEIKKRTDVSVVVSKAHGKLFAFTGGDFEDWQTKPGHVDGFHTQPGVFSADGIDPASAMLIKSLPPKLPGKLADLGAGWGYLASQVLKRDSVSALHLIEADHGALECAKMNVTDPRAEFHWADATQFKLSGTVAKGFDGIVMNPPFHTARAAEPSLGKAFIASAAKLLAPHGTLWMVANRHLPYEAEAQSHFNQVTEIAGDARFKVIEAEKPRRSRR